MRYLLRGGSFYFGTWYLPSTYRYRFVPVYRIRGIGFRMVVKRAVAVDV